jgi:hypothetical protein
VFYSTPLIATRRGRRGTKPPPTGDFEMPVTILIVLIEGRADLHFPPQAYDGHLTLEQATEIARSYADGAYPYFSCMEGDESTWYAEYSNVENPEIVDGCIADEDLGQLTLRFYHSETKTSV